MIRRTYHDGNPEDRAFVDDYWSWLRDRPQDAWLLWARTANWDNADRVFARMVEDPRCDRSVAAWLFWHADPAYYVRNPSAYRPDSLVARIVEGCRRGLYRDAVLHLERDELVIGALDYVGALREAGSRPPFALPRLLCGPFGDRPARLPDAYDDATERDLAELFRYLDGGLPRSEAAHRAARAGDRAWMAAGGFALPRRDPTDLARLDDAAVVEACFGTYAAYRRARSASGRTGASGWLSRWLRFGR